MFRPGRTLTPFDNYGRCSWNRKKTRSYTDFFDPYFSIRIIYSVPLYDDRHLLPDNLIDSLWIINIICFLDCFFSIIRLRFIGWKMNKETNVSRSLSMENFWSTRSTLIAKISCLKIFHIEIEDDCKIERNYMIAKYERKATMHRKLIHIFIHVEYKNSKFLFIPF